MGATLIVRESACLDVEDRRALDAEMCADGSKLDGMGDARIAAAARAIDRLSAQRAGAEVCAEGVAAVFEFAQFHYRR